MNNMTVFPLRVLVVDDSTLMRRLISGICRECATLEVVGEARDGLEALDLAESLQPDVILLDIEMPRMDGLAFLAHSRLRTLAAIIVVSSVVQPGSSRSLEALALGAVDIVPKPSGVLSPDMVEKGRHDLLDAIHACAGRPARRSGQVRAGEALA